MGSKWPQTTIGELLQQGGSIKTGPFGTTLKASEYSVDGVPVISVSEVGNGELRLHQRTPRVNNEVISRLPEYLLQSGDIVFGRKGAVERSAWVKPEQAGWFLGSDGIRLRLPEAIDSRFIAYILSTPNHKSWMLTNCVGTTMPSLNQGVIERIPITLPPLSTQRQIAAILSAFDDKIELNRRMNRTLEQMARALFKSWFVDFDPVRAKMRGEMPEGMDAETAALFPDDMEELEGREVPMGWTWKTVEELYRLSGGSTPSTVNPEFWEGGEFHWTSPKDLSGLDIPFLTSTEKKITERGTRVISSGILPSGTVLLSSRAPVGYLAIATIPISVNQGYIAIEPTGPLQRYFTLNMLQSRLDEVKAMASGTTFPELSKKTFRSFKVLAPPTDLAKGFETSVIPLYAALLNNVHESTRLAQLRDALLPRLLSGELNVSAWAETAEEALA